MLGNWVSPMRKCRVVRGISVKELAVKAGVGENTIFKAERGISQMSINNLIACADVLGVTLDEYTGREATMSGGTTVGKGAV